MTAVRLDGRIGMDHAEQLRRRTAKSGFFAQFAEASSHRILARFHHAARNFEGEFIDPVSKLPDEHQVMLRSEGNHVDPIRRIQHDEIAFRSATGVPETRLQQIENCCPGLGLLAQPLPAWQFRRRRIHKFEDKKNASRPQGQREAFGESRKIYFFGSLIFWPTFKPDQLTPGLTVWRSARLTPFAVAIFMPV